MMKESLTATDIQAVDDANFSYLLEKGTKFYSDGDFDKAFEYYHLVAAGGYGSDYEDRAVACSNLGYCYLYGRGSVKQNTSLAIAYFKIAASSGNIDALYKLGDIYKRGLGIKKDQEKSVYYYASALQHLRENGRPFDAYPSLCLAVAEEKMPGGRLTTDIEFAYKLLQAAMEGYSREISNGADFYHEAIDRTAVLLNDKIFDGIEDRMVRLTGVKSEGEPSDEDEDEDDDGDESSVYADIKFEASEPEEADDSADPKDDSDDRKSDDIGKDDDDSDDEDEDDDFEEAPDDAEGDKSDDEKLEELDNGEGDDLEVAIKKRKSSRQRAEDDDDSDDEDDNGFGHIKIFG